MDRTTLTRGGGIVLAVLTIGGCGSSSTSTTTSASAPKSATKTSTPQTTTAPTTQTTTAGPPQRSKPYVRPASFHIDVTASVARSHIEVSGTTNLPDGTVLTLNAERDFKQTQDAERTDFLGLNGPTTATVPVEAGHFSGQLSSQEHSLAAITQGDPGGPVATVDPDADVCVVLYTGRDDATNGPWKQNPQVRADLGTYGSFLRGSPGVGTFGALTPHPSLDMLATTRVPDDPSAVVSALAAEQSTPQVAPLPNICAA
jgi:hypothetical protein